VILVDTSAFYALIDLRDPNHPKARDELERLATADEGLLSHDHILVESTALIQRRLGLSVLRRFVDDILPLVAIAWVDKTLHLEAREALLASGRRQVSLVDWTSFLVMRRHGVTRAFAFDPDFREQGFEVLPAV
jgi:predicted nucleic acid-binding protein